MSMHFIADGGGTKTEYLLFDSHGCAHAYWRTEGTNATFVGNELALRRVDEGLNASLNQAGINLRELKSISLFIPGFESCIEDYQQSIGHPDIQQMEDFWNAFYGALAMPRGIVALAGTGSFAAGVNRAGEKISVGGWGPLFGDEGSGHHIGVLCLRAVADAFDRDEGPSLLTEMVFREMQIEHALELRKAAYDPSFTRTRIAAMSRLARQAADLGDTRAIALIARAAKELAQLVLVCANRLGDKELSVSITGGISSIGTLYTDPFVQTLREQRPDLSFAPARYDPLVGAVLWYFANRLGVDITTSGMADSINRSVQAKRHGHKE